jgi:phospholipase C
MDGKKIAKVINVLSAAALGTILAVTPVINSQANAQVTKKTSANASVNVSANKAQTTTPIKHVVVIFQENVSFDHYFGTYPYALNIKGEPQFTAKPNTPAVNNLLTPKDYNGTQSGIEKTNLTTANPNGENPVRLDPSQAMTPDMDHGYTSEQAAFDGGKMDKFVSDTGHGNNIVMDYYDGNTVTGIWNYAQNFAMSDNSFGTTYGPSTPGALNLVAGQTHGATAYSGNITDPTSQQLQPDANGVIIPGKLDTNGTLYSDADPYFDKASSGKTIEMAGKNIGDLLNAKNITWGWFEGGYANPTQQHKNVGGAEVTDYIPHHNPFAYYPQDANPNHLPPTSEAMIGKTDQAKHQYGLTNFWQSVDSGNMPAVSFLKAPGYQDGHAGYSDPLDEQKFLTDTINRLEKTPEWKNTAVVINYDDSDGWYDHVMGPQVNGSNDPIADVLYGPGNAGTPKLGNYQDRAGYGPRLPLIVISPYAKKNFVDHTATNQTSIIRFIEDNWNLGRIGDGSYDAISGSLMNMFDFSHGPRNPKLFLDDKTGEPIKGNINEAEDK